MFVEIYTNIISNSKIYRFLIYELYRQNQNQINEKTLKYVR
jgi:hypothetical protein